MYAASERQYTAVGKNAQVPMGGIYATSDGKWSEEIDTQVVKANADLRELNRSVVMKRELSKTADLSVLKSVFVPIPTYGHESWIMTKKYYLRCKRQKWDFCEECEVTQGRTDVRGRSGQNEV